MSEKECNRCLSNKSYRISTDLSETTILPLSLENNSTLAGTCAILDQFGKEFSIPSTGGSQKLPFDTHSKVFEFIMMMDYHEHNSEQYKQQFSAAEEDDVSMLDMATVNCDDGIGNLEDYELDSDTNPQREHDDIRSAIIVSSVQKLFQRQDILFDSTYEPLKTKMCMAFQTDSIERFLKEVIEKPYLRDMKDHLSGTFLHIAVEELNVNFVQCLLRVGFNPNAKEKYGITPIIISVIRKVKKCVSYS